MTTSERLDGTGDVRTWRPPEVSGRPGSTRPATESAAQGSMLTADRLAEIEEHARAEGFERGLAEGRKSAAGELAEDRKRLQQLVNSIHPHSSILDDALLEQLGDLVLAIARQFIRRELKREPGEVVRVVREALAALPAADATVRIHLHPDDARMLIAEDTADAFERQVRVIDDVTLTRGGARIETDVSAVDATVESRLNAIAAQLFGDERHGQADSGRSEDE